jgi:hypothetical protein
MIKYTTLVLPGAGARAETSVYRLQLRLWSKVPAPCGSGSTTLHIYIYTYIHIYIPYIDTMGTKKIDAYKKKEGRKQNIITFSY